MDCDCLRCQINCFIVIGHCLTHKGVNCTCCRGLSHHATQLQLTFIQVSSNQSSSRVSSSEAVPRAPLLINALIHSHTTFRPTMLEKIIHVRQTAATYLQNQLAPFALSTRFTRQSFTLGSAHCVGDFPSCAHYLFIRSVR